MKMKIQVFLSVLILGFWYSIFLVAITKLEYQQALYFNGLETTGIEKYDCNKVVNVLKITDEDLRNKIISHFQIYNQEMNNLSVMHCAKLKDLEKEFDRNLKIAIQNRDRSQMDSVKAKIEKTIPPIRLEVQKHEEILNGTLERILSEKQYKNWLRY